MRYDPFTMERWQSTYEHRVRFNLSESGVHPLSVSELLELADRDSDALDVRLGYGQSNGSDELRARIAAMYPDTSQASIVVTTGGAEANFVACWQLMDSEAGTAVTLPNYMQVPGLLDSFGVPIHPVHLVEEDGWQPNLNELESALSKGARSILITNPSNPTGAVLTEDSMSNVISLADQYGAWILADEVYRGAEYVIDFLPKVKLEIAIADDLVEKAIDAIEQSAKTGNVGDGKIFVSNLEQAVRIRTGETGPEAL